jgi:hypothetical protein
MHRRQLRFAARGPLTQRGITLIGWLILLIPVAVVGYAGLRVTPMYLNYMKVSKTLDRTRDELKGSNTTDTGIRNTLGKHFDIDSIDYPGVKDIKVTRDGHSWVVEAAYDDQAPLFANMAILVSFDKQVRIGEDTN